MPQSRYKVIVRNPQTQAIRLEASDGTQFSIPEQWWDGKKLTHSVAKKTEQRERTARKRRERERALGIKPESIPEEAKEFLRALNGRTKSRD